MRSSAFASYLVDDLLGLEPFAERGEVVEVADQDGHLVPLADGGEIALLLETLRNLRREVTAEALTAAMLFDRGAHERQGTTAGVCDRDPIIPVAVAVITIIPHFPDDRVAR